ncbi:MULTISPECIES: hypothetical protein [Bacillus cereus group]|uniref:hypothetical protein n=1 Tax=Bacillus cereus group TaxID=86661 RepID=UPI00030F8580|nr:MULTISPECIES: hypothetical protein [Bacillus cereus group]UQM92442.1 hypothetical protein SY563_000183 [Bacillus thuringiensis]HDR6292839.1 hypothetical protein [Bacillus cereus]MDA2290990.1 hypothetical protein [Bacillus cereus group sp. Bc191]MDX6047803.1 hypothetical protein [Bacillus paranthracis]MEC1632501.1 hypothetical protein [Bacillus paranthracis]
MAALKETTYIETNTYNEIGFFTGIVWGLVFVVPFWICPQPCVAKGGSRSFTCFLL